jgi:hypothetical protein
MNQPVLNTRLNRQAIADLLWDRFQLQHGSALVPVIGQGAGGSNQSALLGWVNRRVDFYLEAGIAQPLLYLEAELSETLLSSGLHGGELDERICQQMPELPDPSKRTPQRKTGSGLRVINGRGRQSNKRAQAALLVLVNPSAEEEEQW